MVSNARPADVSIRRAVHRGPLAGPLSGTRISDAEFPRPLYEGSFHLNMHKPSPTPCGLLAMPTRTSLCPRAVRSSALLRANQRAFCERGALNGMMQVIDVGGSPRPDADPRHDLRVRPRQCVVGSGTAWRRSRGCSSQPINSPCHPCRRPASPEPPSSSEPPRPWLRS